MDNALATWALGHIVAKLFFQVVGRRSSRLRSSGLRLFGVGLYAWCFPFPFSANYSDYQISFVLLKLGCILMYDVLLLQVTYAGT
jgi:hypothetical protein